MPGLKQVQPQLMPLHVWGLQCYHIQPTVRISLLGFWLVSYIEEIHQGPKFQFWWRQRGCSMPAVSGAGKRLFLGQNSETCWTLAKVYWSWRRLCRKVITQSCK
jgi:hypothetical protein